MQKMNQKLLEEVDREELQVLFHAMPDKKGRAFIKQLIIIILTCLLG